MSTLGQGDTVVVPEEQRAPENPVALATVEDFVFREGRRILEEAAREAAIRQAQESPIAESDVAGIENGQGAVAAFEKMAAFNCIPSCSSTDAKFLTIAFGAELVTLSDPTLDFGVAVPAGVTSFEIGIFDGDSGEPDPLANNESRWDLGAPALYTYRLFADPTADGTGTQLIELRPGETVINSNTMPNNDWVDFTINTGPEAQAPSGNFFYRLIIDLVNPGPTTLNAFKLRSSAVITSIEPFAQPFSYIGSLGGLADINVLYDNFPAANTCTPSATRDCYDGNFTFFFDVPTEVARMDLWDGDFDRGNFDGTQADTDDLDTSAALPPWSTVDTAPEGVAMGDTPSTGNPPDNLDPTAGFNAFVVRDPAVRWDLLTPDGQVFSNDNPSGNQEWEKFTISTDPFDPNFMDFNTATISPGIYRMAIEGVDLQNLNAVQLPFRVVCADVLGNACTPLRPFLVGDTVFLDSDGNGTQDGGEPGIANVVVNLVSPMSGNIITSTTTDADGKYSFPVDRSAYGCVVDASNFEPGGALEGLASTTGGERIDGTVTNDNLMTFDFGYEASGGSIGDFVWLDQNGDGVQDPDEPGLDGVRVQLLNSEGGLVGEVLTANGGMYEFTGLFPDTYTVLIDENTLPSGLVQTFDFDGVETPDEAVVDLVEGEDNTDVDFGYQSGGDGRIGDFVWNDFNGDGVQDPGEPGIDEVTVQLFNSEGELVDVTVTQEGGFYEFIGLSPDLYTVVVVVSTLPPGLVPTFDFDGAEESPNEAEVEIGPEDDVTDIDFGYAIAANALIGDFVWNDLDGDGIQDPGEPGIDGVTVQLFNSEGGLVATTVTAGGGLYEFADLSEDVYTVRVVDSTLPANFIPTFDFDGIATPNEATVEVAGSDEARDIDFGYQEEANALIGDFVWNDLDGDGVQDAGEPGIDGVTVELFNSEGGLVATTVTAGGGQYEFGGLSEDVYTVRIVESTLPANFVPTFDFDGIATPNEATVEVAGNDEARDIDFGYQEEANGLLGDFVWNDLNGDGVQDPGEPGIDGVTVELFNSEGGLVATTVTAGGGQYEFGGLTADTYTVRIVESTLPANFIPTFDFDGIATPNEATTEVGGSEEVRDIDFGYQEEANGLLGDFVWDDQNGDGVQDPGEPGLDGVTVELLNSEGGLVATTVTAGGGQYEFGGLTADTYTVRIVESTLPANFIPTFDFDGLSTPNEATTEVGSSDEVLDIDFGYQEEANGLIGDFVWNDLDGDGVQDAGEPGLDGVTVELLNSEGGLVATTVTAGGGQYEFGGLTADTYTVRIVESTLPANFIPTFDFDGLSTPNEATTEVGGSDEVLDIDFGYIEEANGVLGDFVWFDTDGDGVQDAGEPGLDGVTVRLFDSTGTLVSATITEEGGLYDFTGLRADTYTVSIDPATLPAGLVPTFDLDGLGTPNAATVTIGANDVNNDVDFGYFDPLGSIGDRVWNDADGDGAQDGGESGINDVVVNLLDSAGVLIATTTTAGDGNYLFEGLPEGVYTVEIDATSLPASVAPTFDFDGIATINTATVALAVAEDNLNVDFGYAACGDCEGKVSVLTLQYLGDAPALIEVTGRRGPIKDDPLFSGTVEPGGTFTIVGPDTGNGGFRGTVGTEIEIFVDGVLNTDIHTSCSLPIGPGLVRGDFLVVSGSSKNGGLLCPIGGGPPATDSSIGDRVWLDSNGDGIQDPDEQGLNGVTVELLDSNGDVIASTITTGDGSYGFGNLAASAYSVRVDPSTIPFGTVATFDFDGVGTANVASLLLGEFENQDGVDFGYTGDGDLCVKRSRKDSSLARYPGGHALWMPDVGRDFVFDPSPGLIEFRGDGTARLSGTVRRLADPSQAFEFEAILTGYQANAPSGSPKLELKDEAYVDNGGPIDPATWFYFTDWTGTLTGIDALAGAVLELQDTGAALQVGVGANGKNGNFGLASWLKWTVVQQPTNGPTFPSNKRGDINMDIIDCPSDGSLGGRVWDDVDMDGIEDSGEAGFSGTTVTLLDGAGTTIGTAATDGDGNYLFNGLSAGTYSVLVEQPDGTEPTFDLDGTLDSQTSVVLGPGQSRLDVDFGYTAAMVACGCEGKVATLELEYRGSAAARVEVVGKRGPSNDVLFDAVVQPGETFTVIGPNTGNGGFRGTVGTEISIDVDGARHTTIHTSCSQPVGPGQVAGDFLVISGTSKSFAGPLCPVDGGEDPGYGASPPAMVYPNGGETWVVGSRHEILWDTSYFTASRVKIELSRDGGASFETLSRRTKNDGSHKWAVAGAPSDQMVMRVTDYDDPALFDENDAMFSIPTPSLDLVSPTGGDQWLVGSRRGIEWTTSNLEGNIKIELSRDSGTSFEILTKSTRDDGSHLWTVDAPATSMIVRLSSRSAPELVAESAPFSVPVPQLELLSPSQGEVWRIGKRYAINWQTSNLGGNIKIELSRDGGQSWEKVANSTRNDGSHRFKVRGKTTDHAMIRVSSRGAGSVSETSPVFVIEK